MEKNGESKLLLAFQRLGYDDPNRSVRSLIRDLEGKGQFMYVTHPTFVHPYGYQTNVKEPLYIRLFLN